MRRLKECTVGFALCGSFCTFETALAAMQKLIDSGNVVLPILSFNAAGLDTRFGTAQSFIDRIKQMTGKGIIATIEDAEPIGPKKMCDVLVIAPCTGNTLAKLAAGITDTPVTMAAKSHLRNGRPVVLAISTNDALSASARNIGELFNRKHYYFVPMKQDAPDKKPTSVVADFERITDAIEHALLGKQIQPVFY